MGIDDDDAIKVWIGRHMIVKQLFDSLKKTCGRIPENYLAVDIETSGFGGQCNILQIGHCLVEGGKVIDRNAFLLDWRQATITTPSRHVQWMKTLREDVDKLEAEMRSKGRHFHTTWDRLCQDGCDPIVILREYHDWFSELKDRKWFILMHNGYAFDCRFFHGHFKAFLDVDWDFGDNTIIDTGAVFKAAQLNMFANPGESLRDFSGRVLQVRAKGVRWSLNDYVVPTMKLDSKYQLNKESAHDAGYDSYVAHLMFEELRNTYLEQSQESK